jgi:hypothetical protein
MRAIVIDGFGGVEHLVIKEIPEPEPMPGHAVIKVMAFGINQAIFAQPLKKVKFAIRSGPPPSRYRSRLCALQPVNFTALRSVLRRGPRKSPG